MISFVNAKINIGLQITGKRPDGYHELRTLFYPVGVYAGLPENPERFCDILEITPRSSSGIQFTTEGAACGCPKERNLVWRAADLFFREISSDEMLSGLRGAYIMLYKQIPDGAGMGGGSADGSFTLRMLRELSGAQISDARLAEMALKLGADCPFFIYNRPSYAAGIGERLEPVSLDLSVWWLLAVKPQLCISTAEAFAGVTPHIEDFDLRALPDIPVGEWRYHAFNDFEQSLFPRYGILGTLKEMLYGCGAAYASLTGSGAVVYGLFPTLEGASEAKEEIKRNPTITGCYLLKL